MKKIYYFVVFKNPVLAILLSIMAVAFFALHANDFYLDASSESLVLEKDDSLKYYRQIRQKYGSDNYLVIVYKPKGEGIFTEETLGHVASLEASLSSLKEVESVISILSVPLLKNLKISQSTPPNEITTLKSSKVDKELAEKEISESLLYQNIIISSDKKTTAILVNFGKDQSWNNLLDTRNDLRRRLAAASSKEEKQILSDKLAKAAEEFKTYNAQFMQRQKQNIENIRAILDPYRKYASIYLGGVPMITADSIEFVKKDLKVFGVGALFFIIILLSLIFRRARWVILPLFICVCVGITMVGVLGLLGWPVTIVSSNFMSLLLIFTLSVMVHLIVKYIECYELSNNTTQEKLVEQVVFSMAKPCFYSVLTTAIAFGSLVVSDVRPIIDFGRMVLTGLVVAFILSFTLFPALLVLMPQLPKPKHIDITGKITQFFAYITIHCKPLILGIFAAIVILGILGIEKLTVENKFIDYYKKSTDIYKGMEIIDKELGGTTPLDIIIEAPQDFLEFYKEDLEQGFVKPSIPTGYWFNPHSFETIKEMHHHISNLQSVGKVLSLHNAIDTFKEIEPRISSDSFYLNILYSKLPNDIKNSLISPYISEDGNQIRFSVRVFETDKNLNRQKLLKKIHSDLQEKFALQEDQVKTSGVLVLYNNLLRSLYKSQIYTISVVFLSIFVMFVILFKNVKMAILAIIPNITSAVLVLGIMGWLSIPLDIMTITIAAICTGIAVDDTIHYIHRFIEELKAGGKYRQAIQASHNSVGRAMYYTTMTIGLGFSVMTLSNFVPTIYFGALTALAMVAALIANMTLLPLLIYIVKPIKGDSQN